MTRERREKVGIGGAGDVRSWRQTVPYCTRLRLECDSRQEIGDVKQHQHHPHGFEQFDLMSVTVRRVQRREEPRTAKDFLFELFSLPPELAVPPKMKIFFSADARP